MRPVFTLFIVVLSLSVTLLGCEYCGPSGEPSLNVSLQQAAPAAIDTVYALDAANPISKQLFSTTLVTGYHQLELPLNLNSDHSRYVFQLSGRRDTLTVFYKRSFAYQNRKCGYVLDIYPPSSGMQAQTTRGVIAAVSYLQNRDAKFPGGSQTTHIELVVRL